MHPHIPLFLSLLLAISAVYALPAVPATPPSQCRNPLIRKEWRRLDRPTQTQYLNAVKCLLQRPPITDISTVAPGARNRLDDFVVTHIQQFSQVHFTGTFLPWHRYYTWIYERVLREECGYTGAQPYWDWTLDSPPHGQFLSSPIWDAQFGFGGNGPFVPTNSTLIAGTTGGGCVSDGPFKDMVVNIGPQKSLTGTPRCLTRDFAPSLAEGRMTEAVTQNTVAQATYDDLMTALEGELDPQTLGVHGGGHFSIGGNLGIMGDGYASPSDPIFYLHHTNIDRLWWSWQKRVFPDRLFQVAGPLNFMDYNNEKGGNVTLATSLVLGVNAPTVTVGDVTHIQRGPLCYDYDELY